MVPMSLLNRSAQEDGLRGSNEKPAEPAGEYRRYAAGPGRHLMETVRTERDQSGEIASAAHTTSPPPVELSVLCRRNDQIEAAG